MPPWRRVHGPASSPSCWAWGSPPLQRWRRQFAGDGDGLDSRNGSPRLVSHRLNDEERQRILLTCNEPEFAALPPGQIVPILAGNGLYNSFGEDCVYGSERSFCQVLHAHGQAHRRSLRLSGGLHGLAQPPATTQRHPVHDAPRTPQRPGQRDLSSPSQGLRNCTSAIVTSLESRHPLLASAVGGLDQSTASRKRHRTGYVVDGCLTGGRGIIFPDSHRENPAEQRQGVHGRNQEFSLASLSRPSRETDDLASRRPAGLPRNQPSVKRRCQPAGTSRTGMRSRASSNSRGQLKLP
jgi:hypothetical protein